MFQPEVARVVAAGRLRVARAGDVAFVDVIAVGRINRLVTLDCSNYLNTTKPIDDVISNQA